MEKTDLKTRLLQSITGKQWEKIGVHHHHGINLPLSALHSKNSSGIGEFFDLLPIIDWCKELQIDVIQLLPLNNINSESDPSPYNAISSCALNFLYLSLHALPFLDTLPELKQKLPELTKLNQTSKISYPDVLAHKQSWLNEYYNATSDKILASEEFKKFNQENGWLNPYALFKTLKSHFKNTSWKAWPEEMRYPTPEKLQELYELYKKDISLSLFLQFLSYTQLKEVKKYAGEKGILLMGDVPILLSSESADVWQHLELFDTHLLAGSPPDMYNEDGQNWGFPIFNWDALRKTHFDWWKQRLGYAQNFFDIFRVDHIIGYFRIWTVPPNHPSIDGHFVPEDEKQWEPQGRELLTMLATSTSMLPIGENLGIVPKLVDQCLDEFGICGTKVLRWTRNWEEDKSFIPIEEYPPVNLTCISTHDSETLTLWWTRYSSESKAFAEFKKWTWEPTLTEKQREEILWDSHHTPTLFHINLLQEYFAFFPELSWPNPEDERINIPGTMLPTNWAYRFRPSVEEITSNKELFLKMRKIIFAPSPN